MMKRKIYTWYITGEAQSFSFTVFVTFMTNEREIVENTRIVLITATVSTYLASIPCM